jgi:hypothetical protein
MKAALRFEFLALMALVLCAPTHAQSVSALGSARIVYVGHSLINYDMPEMVKGLAESKGLGIRRAVQVNNGTNIGNNWLGCRQSTFTGQYAPYEFACDAIESGTDQGPYDTLIITQVNNPIIDPTNAANLGSTADDYEKFLNLFLSKNPGGRAFFFPPWEGTDSPWLNGQDWTASIAAQMNLFERVTDRIEQISRDTHGRNATVEIIPSSVALRQLILAAESGQFADITNRSQLFLDDVHMSKLGNYFMACVVFASVYQQSPAGATGRTTGRWGDELTNLPADLALRLQNFAWTAVSTYRGWTGTAPRPRPPTGITVK